MNAKTYTWTEEHTNYMAKELRAGQSFSRIAASFAVAYPEMPRQTRNALIGKWHRLTQSGKAEYQDLSGRSGPPFRNQGRPRPKRPERPVPMQPVSLAVTAAPSPAEMVERAVTAARPERRKYTMVSRRSERPPAAEKKKATRIAPNPIPANLEAPRPRGPCLLQELGPMSCRWPVEDLGPATFRYCNAQVDPKASGLWCEEHRWMAWRKAVNG